MANQQIGDHQDDQRSQRDVQSSTGHEPDAFAGKGLDYMAAGAKMGQLSASDSQPKAALSQPSIGEISHELWLLSGVTNAPVERAQKLAEQFAAMPQEQVNQIGDLLEKQKDIYVTRDAKNDVVSLKRNRDTPDFINPDAGIIGQAILIPAVSLVKGIQAAAHLRRGADVEVTFAKDAVGLHARSYMNITDKPYFSGGTDHIEVPRQIK